MPREREAHCGSRLNRGTNEPNDHGSGPGAARRCHVNTVFQDYALFPHITVAQNIEHGLRVRHVPKAELR